jgi:receptor expression-enhancing protein 5/6
LSIAYASFKAIESPGNSDDKQWLTYWTVIGFVQLLEYFSDVLLYWFPFYYLFKTLFVLYLALPQFRVSICNHLERDREREREKETK